MKQITFKNYISSYIKKRCTQSIPLWLNINTYLLGSVSWYYSNVPLLSIMSLYNVEASVNNAVIFELAVMCDNCK